jgi:hypothetical protein
MSHCRALGKLNIDALFHVWREAPVDCRVGARRWHCVVLWLHSYRACGEGRFAFRLHASELVCSMVFCRNRHVYVAISVSVFVDNMVVTLIYRERPLDHESHFPHERAERDSPTPHGSQLI